MEWNPLPTEIKVNLRNMSNYRQDTQANVTFTNLFKVRKTKS